MFSMANSRAVGLDHGDDEASHACATDMKDN